MNLLPLEAALLEEIFKTEAPEYLDHIGNIEVKDREFTGHGLFTRFRYKIDTSNNSENNRRIGHESLLIFDDSDAYFGCWICIEHGKIADLEIARHGYGDFPEEIANFKIISAE